MRITHGSVGGGSPQSLVNTFTLLPLGTDPQRKYRRTFVLSLPTGGAADGISFLEQTRLRLRFPALEFNALAVGAIETATLGQRGSKVLVQLPIARTIQRVAVTAGDGQTIAAYRTDGEVIAEEAFETANHANGSAALAILDQRVALGRSGGDLLVNSLQQVLIRSGAANPKVGIKVPLLGEDEFFLSGDAGPLVANPAANTTLDAALLRVLSTLAARLDRQLAGVLLPATLAVHLIVESDTPANLEITAFTLDYRLLRRRFATPAAGQPPAKELLRFDGGSLQTRSLTLELPKAAAFARAELRISSTFELARDTAGTAAQTDSGDSDAPAAATGDQALRLRPGVEIASSIPLARALLPEGGTVEILGISGRPRLAVRLYADEAGEPGALLAESSVMVERNGVRQTLRFAFQRSAVVANGAWLSLTPAESEATWLLAAGQPGNTCSRASDGVWSRLGSTARAQASLFGRDGSVAAEDPAKSFKGVRLRIAGTAVAGQPADDEQGHSLIAAVTAIAQSAAGNVIPVAVEVLSSEQGQVTLRAPALEYDVFS